MLNPANPTDFLRIARTAIPVSASVTAILLAIGLYGAFFVAPPDYQQGETIRIMYLHVPSAWLAMFIYTVMTVSAFGTLVFRHPLADAAQKAAAPLGAGFTFICLVTGSLWGKPMWGTWWTWDARLTSELVLLFLYLGVIGLYHAIEDRRQAARAAGFLALVGVVNLPIVHFSVNWWNTLHQGETVRLLGPSKIVPSMLWPLLIMALATHLWFFGSLLARSRVNLLELEGGKQWVRAVVLGDTTTAGTKHG